MSRSSRGSVFAILFTLLGCSGAPPAPAPGPWSITAPVADAVIPLTIANHDLVVTGTGTPNAVVGLVMTRAGFNNQIWGGNVLVDNAGNWTQTISITFATSNATQWDLSLGQMNANPMNPLAEFSRVRFWITFQQPPPPMP